MLTLIVSIWFGYKKTFVITVTWEYKKINDHSLKNLNVYPTLFVYAIL